MNNDLAYLINACRKGEIRAQEKLYRQFYNYGMSVIMLYAKNQDNAGVILNDSFLKIFKSLSRFNTEGNFKAWIRRIFIRTAIDSYRQEMRDIKYLQLDEYSGHVYNSHIIENLEAEDIISLLQSLPDLYRIVFSLFEVEGFSHYEIAEMLHISKGTSRSALSRAKKQLRNILLNIYEPQEKAG